MLPASQYAFLKELIKEANENKNRNDVSKYFNRETINVDTFKEPLACHPELYPAEPFNEKIPEYNSSGSRLIDSISKYLKKIDLLDCIDYYQPNSFGISAKGLESMCEYKRVVMTLETSQKANDIANKANSISEKANELSMIANEKSEKANTISRIGLIFSALAFLISLAGLVLEIIKILNGK